MTNAGSIVWTVPADRSGQEVFHTFRVTVADAPNPKR